MPIMSQGNAQGAQRVRTGAAPSNPPSARSHSSYSLIGYRIRSEPPDAEGVAIGDVTCDGRPDVVVTNDWAGGSLDSHLFVYPGLVDGSLGPPRTFPTCANTRARPVVLADMDEDGCLDVVIGCRAGVSVLVSDGAGGFQPDLYVEAGDHRIRSLAVMDVNEDGHVDVLRLTFPDLEVFHGTGTGALTCVAAHPDAVGADVAVGDVDDDGAQDIVVLEVLASDDYVVKVFHGGAPSILGGAPAEYRFEPRVPDYAESLAIGDLTGDGLNDVVVATSGGLELLPQEAGVLVPSIHVPSGTGSARVALFDLDVDGTTDVVLAHGGGSSVGIFLQDPSGVLEAEERSGLPYDTRYPATGVAAGDVTGDGCPDVVIASYNEGLLTLRGRSCFTGYDDDGDGVSDPLDPCPFDGDGWRVDIDGDGLGDSCDACPVVADPMQVDSDGDGTGDACEMPVGPDLDADDDGSWDRCDNCASIPNVDQWDRDIDGVGDACDACPFVADPDQADADGDLVGDRCDSCPAHPDPQQSDRDLDGRGDACDNCAAVTNLTQADSDADRRGDACDNCRSLSNPRQRDADADGDGDECDNCILVPDATQSDGDSDTVGDACDNCPGRSNPRQEDLDADGEGDACEPCVSDPADEDSDLDGACDAGDNCVSAPNPLQEDTDGDGVGDACECPPVDGIGDTLRATSGGTFLHAAVVGASEYLIHRGTLSAGGMASRTAPYDHRCLSLTSTPSFTDPEAPGAARGFYYLVGARNDCWTGANGLGRDSLRRWRPQPECR